MSAGTVVALGMNVHFWGVAEERLLLTRCLGPLARQLRREGLARSFWFTRFDARGPHIFALLTTSRRRAPTLRARLRADIGSFLAGHPSRCELTPSELRERHARCRGKCLWQADEQPGIAANNSLMVDALESGGYPFSLTTGGAEDTDLWEAVGDRALWSIERLAEGTPTRAAVRWLREVDLGLDNAGLAGADYWRYHASTLLLPLAGRLRSEGEEAVLASLPQVIGPRNLATFSRAWRESLGEDRPAAEAALLVDLAVRHSRDGPWRLLRELNHATLLQLGQPVGLHIPLVLFLWLKSSSVPTVP